MHTPRCCLINISRLRAVLLPLSLLSLAGCPGRDTAVPEVEPAALRAAVDLNAGDSVTVELADGISATVKLLATDYQADRFRNAVRKSSATVLINGEQAVLESGNYSLPRLVGGVRVDCPATAALYRNTNEDRWGLDADARIRLWPAEGKLLPEGSFGYPVDQRFLANDTQMSNEPCYVNGCEVPSAEDLYYHSGLDFGGTEGMVRVLAATDGLVVSVGDSVLDGHKIDTPVMPRYDAVYVLDRRGWYYRYSHLHSIDREIVPGERVGLGQQIGILGKEGGSGGWTHLHFEIRARQPSGRWGTEESYAYTHEAYLDKYAPELIAVARPHLVASAGETLWLEGTRSWSSSGSDLEFEWLFADGSSASGVIAERTYSEPGTFYEALKVTGPAGNVDYDFCVVQILDSSRPELAVPMLHVNYYPSLDLEPGREITFKARTFNAVRGQETWDFGDGSPVGTTSSIPCWGDASLVPDGEENILLHPQGYASITHSYARPGHYLATVRRTSEDGVPAVARIHVAVGQGN